MTSQETAHVPSAPTAAPSPLQIGKAFIKQYYQVLSTNPAQIQKFYKPDSVISHSLRPSVPAHPQTLSDIAKSVSTQEEGVTAAASSTAAEGGGLIFQWCKSVDEEHKVCFDFGRGAIDAQETINGGILLVVTGHMCLPQQSNVSSNEDGMKRFVHTFFLNNSAAPGKKRQFYVHNDVLRFLEEGVVGEQREIFEESEKSAAVETVTETAEEIKGSTGSHADTKVAVEQRLEDKEAILSGNEQLVENVGRVEDNDEEEGDVSNVGVDSATGTELTAVESSAPFSQQTEDAQKKDEMVKVQDDDEMKGISLKEGEKESHESGVLEDDVADKALKSDGKKDKTGTLQQDKKARKNKSRGRSRKSRSSSPTDGVKNVKGKKPAVSGSWASLVAGGSGPSAVAAAAADAASGMFKDGKDVVPAAHDVKDQKVESNTVAKQNVDSLDKPKKNGTMTTEQQQEQGESVQQPTVPSKKAAAAQRTPEATILIKNISEKLKESEIRAMFEPYASKLQKKILGITLLLNRGFCFVDFDSKDVVDEVMKAVEAEKEATKAESKKAGKDGGVLSKFIIHGKELDIARKVPGDKAGFSGRGRGFRRSSSPSRGGGYNKSHRGAGRKSSPRGGNRAVTNKK